MNLDAPAATRNRNWKARTDKATATRIRNNALRSSRKGRLLLVVERCVLLNPGEWQRKLRTFKRVLEELRYACELAKAAGVPCGWLAVAPGCYPARQFPTRALAPQESSSFPFVGTYRDGVWYAEPIIREITEVIEYLQLETERRWYTGVT